VPLSPEKELLIVIKDLLFSKKELLFPIKEFLFTKKEFLFLIKEFLFAVMELLFPIKEFLFTKKELLFPERGTEREKRGRRSSCREGNKNPSVAHTLGVAEGKVTQRIA
jgi:hypothetical protein